MHPTSQLTTRKPELEHKRSDSKFIVLCLSLLPLMSLPSSRFIIFDLNYLAASSSPPCIRMDFQILPRSPMVLAPFSETSSGSPLPEVVQTP